MKELPGDLVKILACPICKTKLDYDKKKSILRCNKCKVNYPVKGGIPKLMPPNKSKL